jgi:molybdate transport repressor ModE-like protein
LHTYGVFDWNDLKHFLPFARTGSMLAAAKALGVNQSTVQRRLTELEDRLGQQLIERHRGGYRLTELGEQLRPDAECIEAAVAAFERHLATCQKRADRYTSPDMPDHRCPSIDQDVPDRSLPSPAPRLEDRAGDERPLSLSRQG